MKDALGEVQSVLVLGGASELGLATVRRLIRDRCRRVVLAGRDLDVLAGPAEQLRAAGADRVETVRFDALDFGSHAAFVGDVFASHGDIDLVLLAFGVLGDQRRAEEDGGEAVRIVESNFTGAVSVLVPVARALREQGHGTIVVLSSVAGEQPRRSNFVYGASKAGLDAFCQGLGDALAGSGVEMMIVRPGFVTTKMTAGREPAPLAIGPDAVAEAVAIGVGRGARIVWVPRSLRYVMSGLRHVPRPVFRRLPL